MNSGWNHDPWLLWSGILLHLESVLRLYLTALLASCWLRSMLCDCQKLAIYTSKCLTKGASLQKCLPLGVSLDFWDVILQVRVAIGVAVCEENWIVIGVELISERQSVVVASELKVLSNLILEVRNVGTGSMPTNLLLFSLALWVDWHLHAVVEHRVGLVVVQNVELYGDTSSRVLDFEVEPLSVPQSVCVILHKKIVLLFTDFSG